MSTLHLDLEDSPLAELIEQLTVADEVTLDRGETPLARVVRVGRREPYVGLYGNHPYEIRARRTPHPPELGPDDFMD